MVHFIPVLRVAFYAIGVYASLSTHASNYPDMKSAHHNAFAVFNSIHSAMRQWGSSVHHNGLSFYLATAPEGSVFYHGAFRPDRPKKFEWLAFEIEHAAQFAASWEFTKIPELHARTGLTHDDRVFGTLLRHRTSHFKPLPDSTHEPFNQYTSSSQHKVVAVEEGNDDDDDNNPFTPPPFDKLVRGYFHSYRANRPLNLLYIDGQAAAKCPLGPLDSQDLILLGRQTADDNPPTFGEWQRAEQLCALAEEWKHPNGAKIDGFIRMEAGFEIIYCDFSEHGGLHQVSVQASSFSNETGLPSHQLPPVFEWLRASAARFDGFPAGRLDIDWSSMVSAYSYPVNISNPDRHRQDLPRLVNATMESRLAVRDRLRNVFVSRGGQEVTNRKFVNWQGVVDKIVTRFSERLRYIASSQWSHDDLLLAVGTIIDPYINYADQNPMSEYRAMDRCTREYLDPSLLQPDTWTPEDHAIATAVERVSHDICESMFFARRLLRSNHTVTSNSGAVVKEAQQVILRLAERLGWSTFRECDRCASLDEICSIPMFPVGASEEDYFHPSCKNITGLLQSFGYWQREVKVYNSGESKRH